MSVRVLQWQLEIRATAGVLQANIRDGTAVESDVRKEMRRVDREREESESFSSRFFFEVDDANRDEFWECDWDCVRDCCRDGRVACGWRPSAARRWQRARQCWLSGGYCGFAWIYPARSRRRRCWRKFRDGDGRLEIWRIRTGRWRTCVLRKTWGKKKQDAAGARKS